MSTPAGQLPRYPHEIINIRSATTVRHHPQGLASCNYSSLQVVIVEKISKKVSSFVLLYSLDSAQSRYSLAQLLVSDPYRGRRTSPPWLSVTATHLHTTCVKLPFAKPRKVSRHLTCHSLVPFPYICTTLASHGFNILGLV